VISDLDIWRAANLLKREHRADADVEAARLQDRCSTAATMTGMGAD
jgi:hypothetical protein